MSLPKLCVFLFVNCIFIFRLANTFMFSYAMKYSEILFGYFWPTPPPPPPPPQLYMLATALDQVPQFLSFLNSQHPNIKFTCEIESNSTLPFLDISITRKNSRFETSVYQKPTFTGLFTNFHSFIPFQYKRCLISSLLYRFFSICSIAMRTSMFSWNCSEKCLTEMVILLAYLIGAYEFSWTKFYNPKL